MLQSQNPGITCCKCCSCRDRKSHVFHEHRCCNVSFGCAAHVHWQLRDPAVIPTLLCAARQCAQIGLKFQRLGLNAYQSKPQLQRTLSAHPRRKYSETCRTTRSQDTHTHIWAASMHCLQTQQSPPQLTSTCHITRRQRCGYTDNISHKQHTPAEQILQEGPPRTPSCNNLPKTPANIQDLQCSCKTLASGSTPEP